MAADKKLSMADAGDAALPNDFKPQESSSRSILAAKLLGATIVVLALSDALDLYRKLGFVFINEQLLALVLGFGLATVFLIRPFHRGATRTNLPWYDLALAIITFGACLYVAVFYVQIVETLFEKPLGSLAAGTIIVAGVAEGLRRTAGPVLFIFVLFFLMFGLLGHFIPGHFQGRNVATDRLFMYVGLDSNGIIGLPIATVVSIVIAFIFFGNLLNASGGANFFTEIATAAMGRYRGGSAKVAIMASSLFGSISGSAVANVVSTGVLTIPMMKKGGYPKEKAAAIEAVASTGGQLMPPMMGAAAFLIAEFLQIPFREVILAALIPAVLYYVALFIQADLYAAREGVKPLENLTFRATEVLARGWPYITPFAVILLGLFTFNIRPQTAAMWAVGVLIPIALLYGYRGVRMHWKTFFVALGDTGIAVTNLLMVSAMAGVVIGVLNITGLGFALTQAIIQLSGGNLALILLLAGAISIVLGMGMPTVGVYLLLATLVVPSMVEAGVPPLAAHMFAFYFGILSMITPPVAAAAFAAATISGSDFIRTGLAAAAFGWPAYVVPFIFVMSPEMLWQGSAFEVARIFVLSTAGVWLISAGWIAYTGGRLSTLWRLLFIASGVLCLVPGGVVPYGEYIDLFGLATGVVLLTARIGNAKRRAQDA
ncbi:TRAP transporter permease [Roseinatronobacter alkalisoli]|uniref:TRAP transporter fused permease subunit n=1 Tax=Roseinatronobacter alkalisoli TaxID=3028235 RepID=A0ABT5TET7_9RHOB|nr:TRAP transporter fused permease subunit [Roseinatronobacter sp. HJB301]MDD7972692.1 TRAP transporter fused permease subunit [Roseinatronobacter sp. HJB301]